MLFLSFRVCPGDHRPWLPQPEPQLAEKALALSHPKGNTIPQPDELGEGFPVPEIGIHSNIRWGKTECIPDFTVLCILESRRPSRSIYVNKTGKPFFLETVDPVFHCTRGISKKPSDFGATHPLCDE